MRPALTFMMAFVAVACCETAPVDDDLKLWYDEPAEKWVGKAGRGTGAGTAYAGAGKHRERVCGRDAIRWEDAGVRPGGAYPHRGLL